MDSSHIKVGGMQADSAIDAIMHGAFTGVKIGVAICAALMAVIPLVHAIDGILFWIGDVAHLNAWVQNMSNKAFDGLSLEFCLDLFLDFCILYGH